MNKIYIYIYTYIYMYVCMYAFMMVCEDIYIYIHVHVYKCTCVHMDKCIYLYIVIYIWIFPKEVLGVDGSTFVRKLQTWWRSGHSFLREIVAYTAFENTTILFWQFLPSRPLWSPGCLLVASGCLLLPSGCLRGSPWVLPECHLGASWVPLDVSWMPPWVPVVSPGCLLGASRCFLGACWAPSDNDSSPKTLTPCPFPDSSSRIALAWFPIRESSSRIPLAGFCLQDVSPPGFLLLGSSLNFLFYHVLPTTPPLTCLHDSSSMIPSP